MAILNEKNDITEKIIHIMITSLCNRKCPNCCNNQYDLNEIPYVTKEELSKAETICLTGGEPFAYANPRAIATHLKLTYHNIKNIYVYSNAYELYLYLKGGHSVTGTPFSFIDGVTVSIKNQKDKEAFKEIIKNFSFMNLSSNILYIFPGFEDTECPSSIKKIKRVWQKTFVAAPNSIFRKL